MLYNTEKFTSDRKERVLMTAKITAKQRRTNLMLLVCGVLVIALKLLLSPWPAPAEGSSAQLSQEGLDRRSREGMITMTINPDPVFETGAAAGNLLIENAETNSHATLVEITRSDTKELIYSSGLLPIGRGVDEDVLAVALPAGDYDCVATFSYVDEETDKVLGSGELGITIHVLN